MSKRVSYKLCEFCNKRVKSKYKHFQENDECRQKRKKKLITDKEILNNWIKSKTIKCNICDYEAMELSQHIRFAHKLKMKDYNGKVISEYCKLKKSIKYRESNFGKNNPMYNKKPWNIDNNRRKEIVEKLGKYWKGKKFSNDHKKKLAKAKTGITGKDANAYGRPHNISFEGRIAMKRAAGCAKQNKRSKGEIELGFYLFDIFDSNDIEIQFELEYSRYDYYIKSKNIIIEYDGSYWHGLTHNLVKLDKSTNQQKTVYNNDNNKNILADKHKIKMLRILETDFQKHEVIGDTEEWLKKLLV